MNLKNIRVHMAYQLNMRMHHDGRSKKANMIFGSKQKTDWSGEYVFPLLLTLA